jgi:hypothetical protein
MMTARKRGQWRSRGRIQRYCSIARRRRASSGKRGSTVLLVSHEPSAREVRMGSFLFAGIRCVGCTAVLAAIPWRALFWALRRGKLLLTDKAGALIGAAAFSFAFAATRLGRPIDDSLHLLLFLVPAFEGDQVTSRTRERAGTPCDLPVRAELFASPLAWIRF